MAQALASQLDWRLVAAVCPLRLRLAHHCRRHIHIPAQDIVQAERRPRQGQEEEDDDAQASDRARQRARRSQWQSDSVDSEQRRRKRKRQCRRRARLVQHGQRGAAFGAS